MHISEGILNPSILLTGAVITAAGVGVGLKKMSERDIPITALMTAFFFVGSLIHIPIGPASGHLVLNGLLGLVLGWKAWPAIFVALVLQAVLFQFGGLTTLGVNTAIIAAPGVALGLLAAPVIRRVGKRMKLIIAGVVAALSVFLSGLLAAIILYITGEGFEAPARLLLLSHIPIALIEGVITAFICGFILKVKPEVFLRTAMLLPLFLIPLLGITPNPAYAHRVNIFAWVEDGHIHGEGYFASGKKCIGCKVAMYGLRGEKIEEAVTDPKGLFLFKCPDGADKVKLVLSAGAGHRAETVLDMGNKSARPDSIPASSTITNSKYRKGCDIEQLLDRKLEPLLQEVRALRKSQQEITFQDVVSGLGYIFGLMGLALYGFSKKK